MPTDLTHRHSSGIHGNDLVVEAVKTPLTLLDDFRLEAGITVTRHGNLHLAVFSGQAFGAVTVAGIARLLAFRITLLITQVITQFGA